MDEEASVDPDQSSLAKAKVIGVFINQVGLPTLIVLVVIAAGWSIIFGITPSPFVSKEDFQAQMRVNDQIHNAMINNATAQTDSIRQITIVLKHMECDMKKADGEKLACFREIKPQN